MGRSVSQISMFYFEVANYLILDTCVTEIKASSYFRLADPEAICRPILDVVFCDRLKRLNDHDSERNLNWLPEVTLSVESKEHNSLVQGRADWCLAYGKSKSALQTALVVLCVFHSLHETCIHSDSFQGS